MDSLSLKTGEMSHERGEENELKISQNKSNDEKKATSGDFFAHVYNNITRLGMGVEEAIFNKKIGAIMSYPSSIIISSMKVLIESSRKGPKIAAEALLNVSRYIKQIHQVNERLRDLLAEVITSMKSQIKFMAPMIATKEQIDQAVDILDDVLSESE